MSHVEWALGKHAPCDPQVITVFTTQVETLKRYRSGGDQTVTVQHVSVTDGGQAIVGNVMQAPRPSNPRQPVNPAPALTDAPQPAMPIMDEPKGEVIPMKRRSRDDGQSRA